MDTRMSTVGITIGIAGLASGVLVAVAASRWIYAARLACIDGARDSVAFAEGVVEGARLRPGRLRVVDNGRS